MSNNEENLDYQNYLEGIHKVSVPEAILSHVVKKATGMEIGSKSRIVAGEVNEVYDITLSNSLSIILRISRNEFPDFLQEGWAIEQCKKKGVLVPEVISVQHETVSGKLLSFCVQKKLLGEPMDRGSIDYHDLEKSLVNDLVFQAGEALSKIHSVPTRGFGGINQEGVGKVDDFKSLLSDKVSQLDEYLEISRRVSFPEKAIESAIGILAIKADKYKRVNSVLNHGDFGPKHIMFSGKKITGIIDWGDASGHSAVHDFARWDYWFGEDLPLELLKKGYSDKKLFNNDFEELLRLIKLHIGLEVLWWYDVQGYKPNIEKAKKQLLLDLDIARGI